MPHEVRGVIAAAKGDKVKVGTVLVPDPGPGEMAPPIGRSAPAAVEMNRSVRESLFPNPLLDPAAAWS